MSITLLQPFNVDTTKDFTFANISVGSGNVSAGNISATNFYFANGASFVSSSYGNTEVAAYLSSYYTYANANAASQETSINSIIANTGSYYSWANSSLTTLTTNAATQASSINTINANLGAYQIYANANAATQATSINTINANIGAFQVYANATFSTGGGGSAIAVQDEGSTLTSGVTQLNFVGSGVTATNVGSVVTVTISGGGSGSYGNVDVDAYLPVYTGNISAGNITLTGNIVGGGVRATTSATAPLSPTVGDIWYSTTDQTTLRYTYDGSSTFWLDISGVGLAANAQSTTELFASYLTTQPTIIIDGNIVQSRGYYETFGNITNSGGNLTCNFNIGSVFYVTSLTTNVTASFSNVNALTNRVTAATLIIDQGATPYSISNIQINGVNQTVRWISSTPHSGTASNTDIVSFSFIHLGGGTYRVLGQSGSYG